MAESTIMIEPFRPGTAIQNRLKEFWCILNWAVPGAVGSIYQW